MAFSISSVSDTSRSTSARPASSNSTSSASPQDFFDQLTQAKARSSPAPSPAQPQSPPPPAKKDDTDTKDKTDATDQSDQTAPADSTRANSTDKPGVSQQRQGGLDGQDEASAVPEQIANKILSPAKTTQQNQPVVTGVETELTSATATKSKSAPSKKAVKFDAAAADQPKTPGAANPSTQVPAPKAHPNAAAQNPATAQNDNPNAQDAAAIASVATASAATATIAASENLATAPSTSSPITAVEGKTAKATASTGQSEEANSQVAAEQSPGSYAAKAIAAKQAVGATDGADDDDSNNAADSTDASDTTIATAASAKSHVSDTDAQTQAALLDLASATNTASSSHVTHTVAASVSAPMPTPQQQFIATNQPTIVSSIHGQLLPNGGTMSIRLDPPELGALQVTVKIQDGSLSAAFETSNDQATRLLTHSLGQLKHALEMQGVTVGHLNVKQAAKSETFSGDSSDDGETGQRQSASGQHANQDQQRREILRRMWQRAAGNGDPLDLVA